MEVEPIITFDAHSILRSFQCSSSSSYVSHLLVVAGRPMHVYLRLDMGFNPIVDLSQLKDQMVVSLGSINLFQVLTQNSKIVQERLLMLKVLGFVLFVLECIHHLLHF